MVGNNCYAAILLGALPDSRLLPFKVSMRCVINCAVGLSDIVKHNLHCCLINRLLCPLRIDTCNALGLQSLVELGHQSSPDVGVADRVDVPAVHVADQAEIVGGEVGGGLPQSAADVAGGAKDLPDAGVD